MDDTVVSGLYNKDADIDNATRRALEDGELLSALLDGLLSKEEAFRYNCVKALTSISRDHGEVLYPHWDFLEKRS